MTTKKQKQPSGDPMLTRKPGDKVKFHGQGGWDHQAKRAKERLTAGSIYTVSGLNVGSFDSTVFLKECPDAGFNTVLFEAVIEPVSKLKPQGSKQKQPAKPKHYYLVESYDPDDKEWTLIRAENQKHAKDLARIFENGGDEHVRIVKIPSQA